MTPFEEAVKHALANTNGDRLLDLLHKHYVQRISFHPDNRPGETEFREGQRDVVQMLLDLRHATQQESDDG